MGFVQPDHSWGMGLEGSSYAKVEKPVEKCGLCHYQRKPGEKEKRKKEKKTRQKREEKKKKRLFERTPKTNQFLDTLTTDLKTTGSWDAVNPLWDYFCFL